MGGINGVELPEGNLFRAMGVKGYCSIIGNFQKACLSNMNEETLEELDVSDGSVVIDIAPYQAVSLKLTSHERR